MTNVLNNNFDRFSNISTEKQSIEIRLKKDGIKNSLVSNLPSQKDLLSDSLKERQVTPLLADLRKIIEIPCSGTYSFFLTLVEFVTRLYKETYEKNEDNKDVFIVGGKASDYIDEENNSNDIDMQLKLPDYTDITELVRLCKKMQTLFTEKTGYTAQELYEKNIFKFSKRNSANDRFVIMKFQDIAGVRYDILLVARTARNSLFVHDIRKISIKSLFKSNLELSEHRFQIINPLNNKKRPAVCIKNKQLRAINPETINFPGCIRLFSYYVKGWSCRDKSLESKLVEGFVRQYKEGTQEQFMTFLMNDLINHHQGCYGAGIIFVFNLLVTLSRYGHRHLCDELHELCLKVIAQLAPTAFVEPMNAIGNTILQDVSAILDYASLLESQILIGKERKSNYISIAVGAYFILFGKSEKQIVVMKKEVPVAAAPLKKETLSLQKSYSTKDWIKQLNSDQTKWDVEYLELFIGKLNSYLTQTKKFPLSFINVLKQKAHCLLSRLADGAVNSRHFLFFCFNLMELNIIASVENSSLVLLRQQWLKGLECDDINYTVLEKVKEYFIPLDRELSLKWFRYLIRNKREKEAYSFAQSLTVDQISSDLCWILVGRAKSVSLTDTLELLLKYRFAFEEKDLDLLQKMVKICVEEQLAVSSSTPNQLNMMMNAAGSYALVDGALWLRLFERGLQNKKVKQRAFLYFIDKVIPSQLTRDDLKATLACWQLVIKKMIQCHDPLIRNVIACSQLLNDCNSEHKIDEITSMLCQEGLHRLKNVSQSTEIDSVFFDYLIQNMKEKKDLLFFIQLSIPNSSIEQFQRLSELLMKEISHVDRETIIKICSLIEKREDFSLPEVANTLWRVIDLTISKLKLKERFQEIINYALHLPSLKILVRQVAQVYLGSYSDKTVELEEVSREFMEAIHLLLSCNNAGQLFQEAHFLLGSLCNISPETKQISECWFLIISKCFDIALEDGNDVELFVKALHFFYVHSVKSGISGSHSIVYIEKSIESMLRLLELDLKIFIEQNYYFINFFSEGKKSYTDFPAWLNREESPKRTLTSIREIGSFKYLSEGYQDRELLIKLGDAKYNSSKAISVIHYHRSKGSDEAFVESLLGNKVQWTCFSKMLSYYCIKLLKLSFQDEEKEAWILDFAAKGIETFIVCNNYYSKFHHSDFNVDQEENGCHLLDIYIKRSGVASKELLRTQLFNSAHLFACALYHDLINLSSIDSCMYFLHLEQTPPIVNSINVKQVALLYVQEIVAKKDVYQLIRAIYFVLSYKRYSNLELKSYKESFINPLISACQNYPKDYLDADGFSVGETIQNLMKRLKTQVY